MGNYRKNIYFGRDSEGKEIRKNIRANSKAELERKIFEAKKDFEEKHIITKVTWGYYSREWLDVSKGKRHPETYRMYKIALDKLNDLNDIPLQELTATDFQRCINAHWDHATACKRIKLTVNQILKKAVREGIILQAFNPADDLEYPSTKEAKIDDEEVKSKRVLTEEEKIVFPEVRKEFDQPECLMLLLLCGFGLRPQEFIPLKKKDFDLEKRRLHITKAVWFDHNKSVIKSTKTGVKRDIPIASALIEEITGRLNQMGENDYFVQISPEEMVTNSWYRNVIKKLKRKMEYKIGHELDPGFSAYTFRHSFATYTLYYEGVKKGRISIKGAARIMGHSEQVFIQIYSHLIDEFENEEEVIDTIQGI